MVELNTVPPKELGMKNKVAKLRKLGDILLDLEPLLDELAEGHGAQMSDILALVKMHLEVHNPGCIEEFLDGTKPIWYYGHADNQPKKELKYPQEK